MLLNCCSNCEAVRDVTIPVHFSYPRHCELLGQAQSWLTRSTAVSTLREVSQNLQSVYSRWSPDTVLPATCCRRNYTHLAQDLGCRRDGGGSSPLGSFRTLSTMRSCRSACQQFASYIQSYMVFKPCTPEQKCLPACTESCSWAEQGGILQTFSLWMLIAQNPQLDG